MYLSAVHLRFYKSFNFDYLRKHDTEALPKPWEKIGEAWYPFVRLPLDRHITTVVGANESGKSHLLSAIEKGLSEKEVPRGDFCRYSAFFTVEKGSQRSPDFGFELTDLSSTERESLAAILGQQLPEGCSGIFFLRENSKEFKVWPLPPSGSPTPISVPADKHAALLALVPLSFRIDAAVGLPSSVPLSWLCGETSDPWERELRGRAIDFVQKHRAELGDAKTLREKADPLVSEFTKVLSPQEEKIIQESIERTRKEHELARDLLFRVARIDEASIKDLRAAIRKGDDGLVNGLTHQINERLARALNFPRWWVQDRDFQLVASAREEDLVFTIRDRTGTDYSFHERSSGLKYFLSYYIRYLSHVPVAGRHEVLLMDEPDAFLSSEGQQDLLKIFSAFAFPIDKRPPVQVVYVTHSPFLIDKNHGERIRVLQKGSRDEGTRVVGEVSRNHYEPLRSAFGAYVGETTFIGNCNVMLEGVSDQILIAGAIAALLRRHGPSDSRLDLNRVTLVPAGSASHVPYMVFLARGRDQERPAIVVMVDGDEQGREALKDLQRGGPRRKGLLPSKYATTVSEVAREVGVKLPDGRAAVELEDLIPPRLALAAAYLYASSLMPETAPKIAALTEETLLGEWTGSRTLMDALLAAGNAVEESCKFDKVGFARSVIEVIERLGREEVVASASMADVEVFLRNMDALCKRLRRMQREAEMELFAERVFDRVGRTVDGFLADHPHGIARDELAFFVEDLRRVLDDSEESDRLRVALNSLEREHDLKSDSEEPLREIEKLKAKLSSLRYDGRAGRTEPVAQASSSQPEAGQAKETPASPT
jgi:predicted ATPase